MDWLLRLVLIISVLAAVNIVEWWIKERKRRRLEAVRKMAGLMPRVTPVQLTDVQVQELLRKQRQDPTPTIHCFVCHYDRGCESHDHGCHHGTCPYIPKVQ